jgi:hypothetical protein
MPVPANDNNRFYILDSLAREADKFSMTWLRNWLVDYHLAPPQTAANDNTPGAMPIEHDTNVYEPDALGLIQTLARDENDGTSNYGLAAHDAEYHLRRYRVVKKIWPQAVYDAQDEMARYLDAKKARVYLGSDSTILDMATDVGVRYRDIGRHVGVTGSIDTLERHGKAKLKSVIKKFADWAA